MNEHQSVKIEKLKCGLFRVSPPNRQARVVLTPAEAEALRDHLIALLGVPDPDMAAARVAGLETDYKYHRGAVEKPLSFSAWLPKWKRLGHILDIDPNGANRSFDKELSQLSRDLGV